MATILTKAELAERLGVTPSAVSQMISSGRIGPEAIVGAGRHAKINFEIAGEQLLRGRAGSAGLDNRTLSKSEFADLCAVSPGRVTQWIAAGQIGPDALDGAGRTARIRVDVATAQLRERLDPSQRFGLNGARTRLEGARELSPPIAHDVASSPDEDDSIDARLKLSKLRQAELATRRAEEQDRLTRGVYVLASSAREQTRRGVDSMLAAFEIAIGAFAAAVADHFALPAHDVEQLLQIELRRVCERFATSDRNDSDEA